MLDKLRRTYGDLLLCVGKGGLAETGLLGTEFTVGHAKRLFWSMSPQRLFVHATSYFVYGAVMACGRVSLCLPQLGACSIAQKCEEWARMPLELHSFPTVDALAVRATEADLRNMGECQTQCFGSRI